MSTDTVIIIPARLASTRLPNKPLALIGNKPMIVHVMERAMESGVGDVYIACCDTEVYQAVTAAGGNAIMTKAEHISGTDRIYEALVNIKKNYQYVINVQGDLPTLDPALIQRCLDVLIASSHADIATLAAPITETEDIDNPNIVKPAIAFYQSSVGRALYFSRASIPHGAGEFYHHIGLYAYRASALKQFVSLDPSPLEQREKLEQLRALENNMRIDVAIVQTIPVGVDTVEDLEKARKLLGY